MVALKKKIGLPGLLMDEPDPFEQAEASSPGEGDTGQAPSVPEAPVPGDGGLVDATGASAEELRARRRMIAQREQDGANPYAPEADAGAGGGMQFDAPDSRPLSLPGSQASSYSRLGGAQGMRPYRTPNFAMGQQPVALDIFEGPAGGLKPLDDDELAQQMGSQFIRRKRAGF